MPVPPYLVEQRVREVQQALRNLCALPPLRHGEVGDDACPICLCPLESIIQEHDKAEEKHKESPGLFGDRPDTTEMTGAVKLSICGHIFCRKDLAEWIESHHGSCPTCRQTFFKFSPIDEAEYESSDGGEYVPDEEDEEDAFTDDGEFDLVATSDIDYDMDDMDSDDEDPIPADVEIARRADSNVFRRLPHALVSDPNAEFRVYASDNEHNQGMEETPENSSSIDEYDPDKVGGLSYRSDSPSSEGVSFNAEDSPESSSVNVGVVLGRDDEHDGHGLSSDVDGTEAKSPVVPMSGSSKADRDITRWAHPTGSTQFRD